MANLIALLFFLGIFTIVAFRTDSIAKSQSLTAKLQPMSIASLPLDQINKFTRPCKNPGTNPDLFYDCKPGEVIAIFNTVAAKISNSVPGQAWENQLEHSAVDAELKVVLSRLETKDYFTGDTRVIQIPQAVGLSESQSQVCGQWLFRLILKPNSTNDASFVNAAVTALLKAIDAHKRGVDVKYIQPTSFYGPQPFGFGAPGQTPTREPLPVKAANWAQQEIGLGQPSILRFRALPSVRVAVLDTGVTDRSFGMRTIPSPIRTLTPNPGIDLSNLDSRPFSASYRDDFLPNSPFPALKGHGTGVASIIGSQDPLTGIAPNANIIPIKICKHDARSGSICDEASAIYATCYAASEGVEASVINMSFGTLIDGQILRAAIRDVTRSGSLAVASAGNTRDELFIQKHDYLKLPEETTYTGNANVYPAFFSGGPKMKQSSGVTPDKDVLLSVGAIYTDRSYAGFATANSSVDLAAPGSWVRVLGTDTPDPVRNTHDLETDPNQNYSGTSFSAAYVSGAAALMIAKAQMVGAPQMNALQLAQKIISTSKPSIKNCPLAEICGKGVLNAFDALQTIR
jgi:subtilisin family serine protease